MINTKKKKKKKKEEEEEERIEIEKTYIHVKV